MQVVYYAKRGDLIKIGCSGNPRERAGMLRAELLAAESGDFKLEKLRHRQFSDLRVTGEWFYAAKDLVAHVEALPPFRFRAGDVLTVADFAEATGAHPRTVQRWVDQGLVRSFRTPTGRLRFHRHEVAKYLEPMRVERAS